MYDGNGVRPSVTQSAAVVHGNSDGLVWSLDHVPPPCDDSEAGMLRMYNYTQDSKHVESKLQKNIEAQDKWENKQDSNNEKRYGIRIGNVSAESVPDTAIPLENTIIVIVNRDRTESATVVINDDAPELESPTASAIPAASTDLNTESI